MRYSIIYQSVRTPNDFIMMPVIYKANTRPAEWGNTLLLWRLIVLPINQHRDLAIILGDQSLAATVLRGFSLIAWLHIEIRTYIQLAYELAHELICCDNTSAGVEIGYNIDRPVFQSYENFDHHVQNCICFTVGNPNSCYQK